MTEGGGISPQLVRSPSRGFRVLLVGYLRLLRSQSRISLCGNYCTVKRFQSSKWNC